ncbi:MAG: beta strand repeat-containing protein [Lysobacterales bacterium]
MRRTIIALLAAATVALSPSNIHAGAYIFAGEGNGVDIVTHPTGYTGTGGNIAVNVCIDPASPNAAAMEIPVQNAIDRLNALVPTVGNVRLGGDNPLAFNEVDFESVFIHELGHCIGLAHVNIASESGLSSPQNDFTKSTDGANNSFDRNDGTDNIIGSADDIRGDDVNLHWFFSGENNPFELPDTPGAGTFSRDVLDLPMGDNWVTNADRTVSEDVFGLPETEAIMQQLSFGDEDQRALAADEIATLMHARAGVDRIAGNADDYTVTLSYGGLDSGAGCDVNVDFDDTQTGFAVCGTGGSFIDGNNVRITSANTFYNTGFNWFFAPDRIPSLGVDNITVVSGASVSTLDGGGTSLLSNDDSGLLLTDAGGFQPADDGVFFGGDSASAITLNSNGTFSYTHDGVSTGNDRFVYRACRNNGSGGETNSCAHQYVNVTVLAAPNDPPVAVNDGPGGLFQVNEGASVTLSAANLSANDTDTEDGSPPGGAISIAGSTTNGAVVDNGNQTFTFTHNDTETTAASFQYQIADSTGQLSGVGTVNLTVNPQNDDPVANADGPGGAFTVSEGMTVTLTAAQLTADDTDAEDGTPPAGGVSLAGGNVNGVAVDNGNQTFTFTHDDTETTSASFAYRVADSEGTLSNTATVSLTVTAQNDDPVAADDGPGGAFTVSEGLTVTVTAAQLTANDTDSEDGTPPGGTVSLDGGNINGTAVDNGNQTFTFTHDDTETTSAAFAYRVTDNDGAMSNSATVSLTVTAQNDTPVANDDGPGGGFVASEGGNVTLSAAQLTANDTDPEDGMPQGIVSLAGNASNGTAIDNGNQTFTFTHDGSETLTAAFQYRVRDDDNALSNTATVNLSISPVNNDPVAVNDGPGGAFVAQEGASITLNAAQLAANDNDAEDGIPPGGPVTIAGATSNGAVIDNGNQTFTFTHDGSETSSGSFQYRVTDSDGALSNLATVSLSISAQNDSPTAGNDGPGGLFIVAEGVNVTFTAAQLASNDSDAEDGIPAGLVSLTGTTANGIVADNGNQTFTFSHDGSETSAASFQYVIADAAGSLSNTATVSLSVTATNDAPVAVDDGPEGLFAVDEGLTVVLSAAQLISNDSDAEDGLPGGIVTVAGATTNGAVTDNGNQTFTFTHDGSQTLSASFQYLVNDSESVASNLATVNLTVNPSNDAPTATDDGPGGAFIVEENASVTVSATQLTANDSDPEDGTPGGTVRLVSGNNNGSATDNGDQTFTFTHNGSETTTASFEYEVTDSGGQVSNVAQVNFTVTPVNDIPTANDDGPGGGFGVEEGLSVTLSAAQLAANDTDAEDGVPQGAVTLGGLTVNGTVADNGDQTFTFTHNGDESADASFQYQIADADGALSNLTSVSLQVIPVNDDPVAQDDGPGGDFSVDQGLSVTLSAAALSNNDTDAEDGTPTGAVALTGTSANGSAVDNGDQTFTFTHDNSNTNSASFGYQVSDSEGGLSAEASVNLSVKPTTGSPPPVAQCARGGRRIQVGISASIATAQQFELGGSLAFSQTGLPMSLSIDQDSGQISGQANSTDLTGSPFQVSVTASNGSDQETLTFLLTVDGSNDVSFFSSFEDSCFSD